MGFFVCFFFSELGPYALLKISSGAEHTQLLLDPFCKAGLALTQCGNPQSGRALLEKELNWMKAEVPQKMANMSEKS